MEPVYIYTDGACSGNPGPGGWGSLVIADGTTEELSGGQAGTTNNRMELQAVIEALQIVDASRSLIITTDSEYVKNGITQWIHNWVRNNWQTAAKKPVKNQDLWKELLELTQSRSIEWRWVKGHSGHPENERCDQLARRGIEQYR